MKKTLVVAILIVAMILGIVAYAFAIDDLQTVLVSARVNPKFSMTLTPDAENFNGVDPDATYHRHVGVSIDSNRSGHLDASWVSAPDAAWHLSHDLTAQQDFGKGQGQPFPDIIYFAPDYGTPSFDTATEFTMQYSAIQGSGD
jgi:hypothetical protein